jgi:hypothetical protein
VVSADPLKQAVYASGGYKPFGELTLADVESRAQELRSATGFGPTARVASVARAWSELAARMRRSGAGTVAELRAEVDAELARRLWVLPPL